MLTRLNKLYIIIQLYKEEWKGRGVYIIIGGMENIYTTMEDYTQYAFCSMEGISVRNVLILMNVLLLQHKSTNKRILYVGTLVEHKILETFENNLRILCEYH